MLEVNAISLVQKKLIYENCDSEECRDCAGGGLGGKEFSERKTWPDKRALLRAGAA